VVIGVAAALALRGLAHVPSPASSDEQAGPLLGLRIRAWYRGVLAPLEDALVGRGVHPDTITLAQLGVSVVAGAAFWKGWMFLAGWLTILAGTLDVLDGGVARRGGMADARGALVDSLADRSAEFVTFVGLGAFFRASWVLLVVALAAFGSLMVSYTRARAEGLGLDLHLGQAQRPERYLILGTGAWLSGVVAHLTCGVRGTPTHVVLEAALVVLAALSTWTAVQRTRYAIGALGRRAR
jgi:CDP-diacylglycerol--glycerol-3-phosphate 3-phosphatidyltransferase